MTDNGLLSAWNESWGHCATITKYNLIRVYFYTKRFDFMGSRGREKTNRTIRRTIGIDGSLGKYNVRSFALYNFLPSFVMTFGKWRISHGHSEQSFLLCYCKVWLNCSLWLQKVGNGQDESLLTIERKGELIKEEETCVVAVLTEEVLCAHFYMLLNDLRSPRNNCE